MTMTSLSGKGAPFIRACIENPRAIVDDPSVNLIFRVTGVIMAWCSLEHSMLVEGGAETVSPELMRTSLWVSRRLLAALSAPEDILQPLSDKFGELCADVTSNESHIADLLDCFAGVAQAAQQHSAPVLFKFISPILARCVGVFCAKKDSQVLVNAVLDLFAVVTRKLSIYVDAAEDSRFLHQ
uniref:Uncharacterized protein n=1 Tax=Parascaris equorum TaxID=6256 RepID=A0A914RCC6_PAREQ